MENLITNQTLLDQLKEARANRKPWLGKNAMPDIDDYFSVKEFESLINQTGIWNSEKLQVLIDNKQVPPNSLFQIQQTSKGAKHLLNASKLQDVLNRGSSIVLNDVCELSQGIMEIREIFGTWTGGKLDCNVYFSQKGHQAFPIHYDVHDVLAIQVEGRKHWQIFPEGVEYPINHPIFLGRKQMNPAQERPPPILDFIFEPGDLVYIPSGYFHHATCLEGKSLHLSYGLVEMIGMDIISLAFEMAMRDSFFRTPVKAFLRNQDPSDFYLRKWSKKVTDLSRDPDFKKQFKENLDNFKYRGKTISIRADKD